MVGLKGELVSISTDDRVRLDGFYCEAEQPSAIGLDAAIITHGLGGNFYGSRLLKHLASVLHELGMSVVLANTRGHDNLTTTVRMGQLATLGAGYEIVSDCRLDLKGWSDFLIRRGHQNQLLFGHSLGAIKSLYAFAHESLDVVKSIVALSATRLSHERLLASKNGENFREMLRLAKSLVDEGKPDELMKVTFPFSTWMAAGPYLEKYGPEDRYNWFRFADRITVPTLLVYGETELAEHPAFQGMESEIQDLQTRNSNLDFKTVPKADHFYSGCFQSVGEVVKDWLQR